MKIENHAGKEAEEKIAASSTYPKRSVNTAWISSGES
jgi:hypothetical protein